MRLENDPALLGRIHRLIARHRGRREVTLNYLIDQLELGISRRTLQRRFKDWGVRWVRPKLRPDLSEQDVSESFEFCTRYLSKPKSFYARDIHCYIDCKWFKVNNTRKLKNRSNRMSVRGVFKVPGRPANLKCFSKPSAALKSGAKSVCIAGAIGRNKVLLFEPYKKWNARSAASFYRKLARKVRRQFQIPNNKPVVLLEDNDPSGFNSRLAIRTKQELNIRVIKLPKRRNPLDFSFWAHVNTCMREVSQGKSDETKQEYIDRLIKVAMKVDREYILRTVKDMYRRIHLVHRARGRQIVE